MEIWKPVLDLEDFYEVSNLGNVRSKERVGKTSYGNRKYGGCQVNPFIHQNGYLTVNLTKKDYRKQFSVHTLVIEAFLGKRPNGLECCHNDGNRLNAKLENLRWDTRKNNHADKVIHGTRQSGEKNGASKLTNYQAKLIKESTDSARKLAKQYNVGQTTILKIKHNQSYCDV